MTTKWSHLPNAAHVDAVIASLKANPEEWDAAQETAWNAAYSAARNAARVQAHHREALVRVRIAQRVHSIDAVVIDVR